MESVFTFIPMASYPKSNRLFIKKEKLEFGKDIEGTTIPFVNVPIIKQISVFVSLVVLLVSSIISDKKDGFREFKLFNINVHVFFSIPVFLVSKLYKCRKFCFLADNVVEKRVKTPWKKCLYGIDGFVAKRIFKTYNGIITYSCESAKKYAPEVPCLEILHVVNAKLVKPVIVNELLKENIVISFTGSLTDFNGIKYIVDAMNYLPGNYILNICGDGKMKEYVLKKSKLDNRIKYHGFVSNREAMRLQSNSDILLLIRTMDNDYDKYLAQYAVSGKLPEYLATGVPVITNDIPAIPKEFRPYLNIIDNYDPVFIAKKIMELTEDLENYSSKVAVALRGRDYVLRNCNWRAQSSRIEQFINESY